MNYLLIITTEDLKDCFGDYIRFKQSTGFNVELKTVGSGVQAEDIQNILSKVSITGPFFVLIGGLIADVPSMHKNIYSLKTGNRTKEVYASDSAYNIKAGFCKYYIGRFPTNVRDEMILLCNNAIEYSAGSTSKKVIMLISGDENSEHIQDEFYEKNSTLIGMNILKLPKNHDSIVRDANNYSLISFFGHGSENGWSPNISDTDFIPFSKRCHMAGLCCSSCQYDNTPTFGPKLLIQKKLASYLGASSNCYILTSLYLENILLKKYIKGCSTIGELYLNSIYEISFEMNGQQLGYWTFNLMGDPTLPL